MSEYGSLYKTFYDPNVVDNNTSYVSQPRQARARSQQHHQSTSSSSSFYGGGMPSSIWPSSPHHHREKNRTTNNSSNNTNASSPMTELEIQNLRHMFEERLARAVHDMLAPIQAHLRGPVVQQLSNDDSTAPFLKDHVFEIITKELRSQLEHHNVSLMRVAASRSSEVEHLVARVSDLERQLSGTRREAELEITQLQHQLNKAPPPPPPPPTSKGVSGHTILRPIVRFVEKLSGPGVGASVLDDTTATKHSISLFDAVPSALDAAQTMVETLLEDVEDTLTQGNNNNGGNAQLRHLKERLRARNSKLVSDVAEFARAHRYLRRLVKDKEREVHVLQTDLARERERHEDTLRQIDERAAHEEAKAREALQHRVAVLDDEVTQLKEERSVLTAAAQYALQSLTSTSSCTSLTSDELARGVLTAVSNVHGNRVRVRGIINRTLETTLSCVRELRLPLQQMRHDVVTMQHSVMGNIGQFQRLINSFGTRSEVQHTTLDSVLTIVATLMEIPTTIRSELVNASAGEVNVATLEAFALLVESLRNKMSHLTTDVEKLRHDVTEQRRQLQEHETESEDTREREATARRALNEENAVLTARVQALSRRLEEEERVNTSLHERCTQKEAENVRLQNQQTAAVARRACGTNHNNESYVSATASPPHNRSVTQSPQPAALPFSSQQQQQQRESLDDDEPTAAHPTTMTTTTTSGQHNQMPSSRTPPRPFASRWQDSYQ